MYPDLSYLLHALVGTQPDNGLSVIKTFGLFLALSFLTSAWLLSLELRRKEAEGLIAPMVQKTVAGRPPGVADLLSSAFWGFILGFKLPYLLLHFSEFQADAAGVLLSARGSGPGGLLGALLLAGYRYYELNRSRLDKPVEKEESIWPHERVGDITMVAAVTGLTGAKLFAVLEDPGAFFRDPLGQFFSGSGLAMYGGLVGGFIGVYWFIRRLGIRPLYFMDAVATALIMGYAVGRLGCHFSGDGDWGIASALPKPGWFVLPDWLWAFRYPHNVINEGVPIEGCVWHYCRQLEAGVYPTPLYESFMAGLIGALLWWLRKRLHIHGMLFFIYLFLNGVERFFIEKIRVNVRYDFWGFHPTQAEIIAVLLIAIGAVGSWWLWRRARAVA